MPDKLILKKMGKRVLLKCPDCGTLCEVSTSQIEGQRSIRCPMVACVFCETLDLTKIESKVLS